MKLREYKTSDCEQLAELFYNTVHSINAKHYTEEQLDVWATGKVDLQKWNRSFLEHKTVVATEKDQIVGFGDIDQSGYLDRLYVHKDYQGMGIASAICNELECAVAGKLIITHASITAKPFFKHRGYKVVLEQEVVRQGIALKNYVMEKEMNKIIYRKTTKDDMEILIKIRLEMLREVNNLSYEYEYDEAFISESRRYFESGEQTTVIALDGETPVGCASLSYIWIMPTFSHPTGKRAHVMNVYTHADYRRRGISKKMVSILIDEAKENGVTEISLDATEMGRPLYESLGFKSSESCMVMELKSL